MEYQKDQPVTGNFFSEEAPRETKGALRTKHASGGSREGDSETCINPSGTQVLPNSRKQMLEDSQVDLTQKCLLIAGIHVFGLLIINA